MAAVAISTSWWHDVAVCGAFGFFMLSVLSIVVLTIRDRRRSDRTFAEALEVMAAEAKRWRPVFWSGCHEYQQHDDGRRRALRSVDGVDVLRHDWLAEGKDVTK